MDNAHAPSTSNTQADTADTDAPGWAPALIGLYLEHFDRLVGELVGRFGDRTIAEDAVQDAFVAFHTKGVVTAPGREVGYLATSARNNVLLWLRREGRRSEIVASSAPSMPYAPSAEQHAMVADEAEQWSARIADLPEQQAAVITLRHVGGMSVGETAAELGVSTGTIKTHSHRGVRALRRSMSSLAVAA